MTAKGLKKFLISFVEPQHQGFDVRFVSNQRTRCVGDYVRKTRLITIYPDNIKTRLELLATGLHELAHHLTWECSDHMKDRSLAERKRTRHHGKEFVRQLKQLTQTFNFKYGERMEGFMYCSARRPTHSPKFVKFSQLDYVIDPASRGFVITDRLPRYAMGQADRTTIKRGRTVFLIGFNGRNEGVMYSRQTKKFDYKIPTGWMRLICRCAAARPKAGELWEFGLMAKRVLNASGRKVG